MANTTFAGPIRSESTIKTISKNSSTGTITEVITMGDAPVALGDEDKTLDNATHSGRVLAVPALASNRTITLPAPVAGATFKFIYAGAAEEAENLIIITPGNTNFFLGNVQHLDTNADNVSVYANGSSNSKLTLTDFGSKLLKENPDNPGSLGIAISEAIEATVKSAGKAKYSLGSVLGHVLMHQTINGNEAIMQMEMAGDYPDIIVGCTGGGSNLSGLMFPFLGQQLRGGQKIDIIGCEPASCPSFTKGKYAYDHGDMAKMTPLIKMHTLGSDFLPPANHSGGLRYHGMSYHLSHLYELGLMRAKAYGQKDCFEAGLTFAKQEGIIPAPEGNHAIKGAIDAALECKEKGESKTILFNLCGHGYFDMSAYDDYLNGSMADDVIDDDGIGKSISQIPEVA